MKRQTLVAGLTLAALAVTSLAESAVAGDDVPLEGTLEGADQVDGAASIRRAPGPQNSRIATFRTGCRVEVNCQRKRWLDRFAKGLPGERLHAPASSRTESVVPQAVRVHESNRPFGVHDRMCHR